MRGDLREGRDPTLGTDFIRAVYHRRQDALADAVLIAWSAARRSEHELVSAGGPPISAPRVQLFEQVQTQVDLADTRGVLACSMTSR